MNQTSLLIMAAGIGSRYGVGIKQLEGIDKENHLIIDYSIHDAIEAGFSKIVFIIRKDIEEDFKERIGDRIEAVCKKAGVETAYVFQNMEDIPEGFEVPEGRKKPWGTGQAVLAAKDIVKEPFAVINADDYYGKTAFAIMHDWLARDHAAGEYSLAGFILKNTLSENGGVTRGLCETDGNGWLTNIDETKNIIKTPDGAEAGGKAINPDMHVSMNMWALGPEFMETLEEGFIRFFEESSEEELLSSEYLLPVYIGELLHEGRLSVKVLETKDSWFGVTYAEDKAAVVEEFKKLLADGVYSEDLYGDL